MALEVQSTEAALSAKDTIAGSYCIQAGGSTLL